MLPGLPAVISASEKESRPRKFVGLVTEVRPTTVTVHADDGSELTLATREDFTQKVAVGSKVTAWYSVDEGVYVIQWMEHPLENSFFPASQIRGRVKKIIILPKSGVPDADGLFDAITTYLESNLGWYVAPRMLAEEIRDRAGKSVSALDAIDPSTGQFDIARYVQGQQSLVTRLASETRVDAVLEVDVVEVQAKVRRMVAAWDGVEEPIAGMGPRTLAKMTIAAPRGQVSAATVILKLWDAEGKLLWSNRRGFAVLARLVGMGSKLVARPLPEALRDTARVQEWLTTVFGSFLPASSSLRKPEVKP